jgi:hypothetical protein
LTATAFLVREAPDGFGDGPFPTRLVDAADVIATLEAVLIRVTTPSLNHQRASIPKAELLVQPAPPPRPHREYLADIERELRTLVTQAGIVST